MQQHPAHQELEPAPRPRDADFAKGIALPSPLPKQIVESVVVTVSHARDASYAVRAVKLGLVWTRQLRHFCVGLQRAFDETIGRSSQRLL